MARLRLPSLYVRRKMKNITLLAIGLSNLLLAGIWFKSTRQFDEINFVIFHRPLSLLTNPGSIGLQFGAYPIPQQFEYPLKNQIDLQGTATSVSQKIFGTRVPLISSSKSSHLILFPIYLIVLIINISTVALLRQGAPNTGRQPTASPSPAP